MQKLFHCDKVLRSETLDDLEAQLHRAVYPEGLVHLEFLGEGWYESVIGNDTIMILKSGDSWLLFLWLNFDPRATLEKILC
jgi:hypothetical protein